MKNKKEDNSLKMASILCFTILGIISLIGIFFGREGLIQTGIGVVFIVMFSLFMWTFRD